MARKRSKTSKIPYAGLGLDPEEDKKLAQLLEAKDLSAKQLLRALVRKWMEENG